MNKVTKAVVPEGWRDDLDLIRACLEGYPSAPARNHAMSVIRKLLAAPSPAPVQPADDAPVEAVPVAYMHTLSEGTFGEDGWNTQFLRNEQEAKEELFIHGGTVMALFTQPPQVQQVAAAVPCTCQMGRPSCNCTTAPASQVLHIPLPALRTIGAKCLSEGDCMAVGIPFEGYEKGIYDAVEAIRAIAHKPASQVISSSTHAVRHGTNPFEENTPAFWAYEGWQEGWQAHISALSATIKDERALFENYCSNNGYPLSGYGGHYSNIRTRNNWMGWQARAALAHKPASGEA